MGWTPAAVAAARKCRSTRASATSDLISRSKRDRSTDLGALPGRNPGIFTLGVSLVITLLNSSFTSEAGTVKSRDFRVAVWWLRLDCMGAPAAG